MRSSTDTYFYAEWDDDSGLYCCFGDNSGFAYSSYSNMNEAERDADKRNARAKEKKEKEEKNG